MTAVFNPVGALAPKRPWAVEGNGPHPLHGSGDPCHFHRHP